MQEAANKFAIPTSIYRLGMKIIDLFLDSLLFLSFHSFSFILIVFLLKGMMSWNTINGDGNMEDWFNRYLMTCLITSCCPAINASYSISPNLVFLLLCFIISVFIYLIPI